MEEVIHCLDSLVTTINPDLNAPPSDHHPCQKHSEDFNDDMQDYVELIDNNDHLELTTTRSDPLINPHDRIQLQEWRANVDLIPILTKQYVSKYVSEAEPQFLGSLTFSEVLDKTLRNDNPMIQLLKHSKSCSFTQSEERDFSAQET